MSKRLRWKKEPAETGLAAVGAGPRGSVYHDGAVEYAHVCPLGGGWIGPLIGWYWVAGWDSGVPHKNTHKTPAPDESTAKKQAEAYVKEYIK